MTRFFVTNSPKKQQHATSCGTLVKIDYSVNNSTTTPVSWCVKRRDGCQNYEKSWHNMQKILDRHHKTAKLCLCSTKSWLQAAGSSSVGYLRYPRTVTDIFRRLMMIGITAHFFNHLYSTNFVDRCLRW